MPTDASQSKLRNPRIGQTDATRGGQPILAQMPSVSPNAPARATAPVSDDYMPPEEFDKLPQEQKDAARNAAFGSRNARSFRIWREWKKTNPDVKPVAPVPAPPMATESEASPAVAPSTAGLVAGSAPIVEAYTAPAPDAFVQPPAAQPAPPPAPSTMAVAPPPAVPAGAFYVPPPPSPAVSGGPSQPPVAYTEQGVLPVAPQEPQAPPSMFAEYLPGAQAMPNAAALAAERAALERIAPMLPQAQSAQPQAQPFVGPLSDAAPSNAGITSPAPSRRGQGGVRADDAELARYGPGGDLAGVESVSMGTPTPVLPEVIPGEDPNSELSQTVRGLQEERRRAEKERKIQASAALERKREIESNLSALRKTYRQLERALPTNPGGEKGENIPEILKRMTQQEDDRSGSRLRIRPGKEIDYQALHETWERFKAVKEALAEHEGKRDPGKGLPAVNAQIASLETTQQSIINGYQREYNKAVADASEARALDAKARLQLATERAKFGIEGDFTQEDALQRIGELARAERAIADMEAMGEGDRKRVADGLKAIEGKLGSVTWPVSPVTGKAMKMVPSRSTVGRIVIDEVNSEGKSTASERSYTASELRALAQTDPATSARLREAADDMDNAVVFEIARRLSTEKRPFRDTDVVQVLYNGTPSQPDRGVNAAKQFLFGTLTPSGQTMGDGAWEPVNVSTPGAKSKGSFGIATAQGAGVIADAYQWALDLGQARQSDGRTPISLSDAFVYHPNDPNKPEGAKTSPVGTVDAAGRYFAVPRGWTWTPPSDKELLSTIALKNLESLNSPAELYLTAWGQ